MEFEKLNKKLQEQQPRSVDNTFTNENEIRYPTEDDFVDIKVLNNNIRLLDEQKVGGTDLQNVAKETTPKNIENIVKATQNTTNTINSNVSSIKSTTNTINTNVSNIKSTVDTINSNVNNINSNIATNLQGVAKERSQYSIEDISNEISTKADTIIEKLENVATETSPKNIENIIKEVQNNVQTLLETKGVVKNVQRVSGRLAHNEKQKKISIDTVNLSKTYIIVQGFTSSWEETGPAEYNLVYTAVISIMAYLSSSNELIVKQVGEVSSYEDNSIDYDVQIIEFY